MTDGRPPGGVSISVRQRIRPPALRGAVLKGLVRRALVFLGAQEADVRVLIVGDAEMARWNRTVFDKPRTTNVISFPEDTPEREETRTVRGDILVSAPTCLRQTRDWRGTPEDKVFFFVLHGLLHLAGFDHAGSPAPARRMRRKELAVYRAVTGTDRR